MGDKEYIDKVAFNNAIRDAVKKYPNSFYNGLEVARQIAHGFPAADVRPVALCRDCRSYNKPRLGFCETHLVRMHRDDYCSYGKKREES